MSLEIKARKFVLYFLELSIFQRQEKSDLLHLRRLLFVASRNSLYKKCASLSVEKSNEMLLKVDCLFANQDNVAAVQHKSHTRE